MTILIWLLTAVHVLVALVLVILVLMQKSSEQGVGAAFGGAMTETVFGGSITPLVRMTIWCACIMLGTTVLLAALHARRSGLADRTGTSLGSKLHQSAPAVPGPAPAPAPEAPPVTPAPTPAK
jgi:preprotein translocase subunit SecG